MAAVSDGIRIVKAREKTRIVERNARHEVAGKRVTHLHGGRLMGVGEHRVLEPKLIQSAEDIRAELDAGPEFLEFRGLLKDPRRHALSSERISCRQTADTAACDQNRRLTIDLNHRR
jgi:hypothetical protein